MKEIMRPVLIFGHGLAIALLLASLGGCHNGTSVGITNKSNKAIQTVVIRYTGGVAEIKSLGVDERREVLIHPTDESHVELDIIAIDGRKVARVVDTYLEDGYGGKLEIRISPGFVATVDGT